MIVLVFEYFDGVLWFECVYVVGTLWDAYEMGAFVDVHAYMFVEFERKRDLFVIVCMMVEIGFELLLVNA